MTTLEKAIKGLHEVGNVIGEKKGIEESKPFLRSIDYAIKLLKKQKKQIDSFKYQKKEDLTVIRQLQDELESKKFLIQGMLNTKR